MSDGSDFPEGPKIAVPNYQGNTRMRDALGNKQDIATATPTASAISLLREIIVLLGGSSTAALVQATEMPEFSYVNASIVYAVSVLNRQTQNPIPSGSLTAGTIDVIRIRAGVETTISAGVTLLKEDGVLYYIIDLTSVSWQEDDTVKVIENTKSTATIGINTYDILQIPQTCLLTDLGDISTQIDTIETVTNETNSYLEDGGRIDNLLDDILATCNDIEVLVQHLRNGMLGKENPVLNYPTPGMPSTNFGFSIWDLVDGIGGIVSVTPGTCDVYRYRQGIDVTWLSVISGPSSVSPANDRIFYAYNFPPSGWNIGDLAWLHFEGASVEFANGKTVNLPEQNLFMVVGLGNILQDLADGGRLDLILDQTLANTAALISAVSVIDIKIDNLQADVTVIDGKIDALQVDIDAMEIELNDLWTWWSDGGRLDLVVDDILANTVTIIADIAVVDSKVDAIQADITTIDGKIDVIDDNVDELLDRTFSITNINDKINSELIMKEFGFSVLPEDASDHILYTNEQTKMKDPILVRVTVSNMAVGDTITLTEEVQVDDTSVWVQSDFEQYDDLKGGLDNGDEVIEWLLTPNRFGIRLTFNQTASSTSYTPPIQFKIQVIAKEGV